MQVWRSAFGEVASDGGSSVTVDANGDSLYDWSHRPGAFWPCSYLDDFARVTATIDARNGDLIDLRVECDARVLDSDEYELPSDELTAWMDDCLADTPYAHLARNPATV